MYGAMDVGGGNRLMTTKLPAALRAAMLMLVVAAPAAHAEGPMNTDDAGTLDKGGMKVEAVLSRDDRQRAAEVVFGFGVIENVEIGITVSRATDYTDDPATKMTGTGFSAKWVPMQRDTGLSLGIGLGYGDTKVDERATPDRFTEKEYSLAGLATYRFDGGQVVHMNLGSTRVKSQGNSDSTGNWGIGYEFPLTDKLQFTLEGFGEEGGGPDKAAGLRYEIVEGLKAYAAAGHGNDRSFGNIGVAWEF